MITDDIAKAALTGPWQAVLAYRDGYLLTMDDFDGNGVEADDVRIQIVRGTALPTDRDGTGELRLAGTYESADLLVEWDGVIDFEDVAEVRTRWVQAQAVADGLNQAAEEVRA